MTEQQMEDILNAAFAKVMGHKTPEATHGSYKAPHSSDSGWPGVYYPVEPRRASGEAG